MKKLRKTMFLTVLAVIMQGCISSNTFQPVKLFDIGQPEARTAPAFQLTSFTIDPRYSKDMFVRTSETTVDYAPYSNWILSPELLLQNFIAGAADEKDPAGELSVNILAIELIKSEKRAYFAAEYTLVINGKLITKRVVSSEEVSTFSPKLFAEAYRTFALKLLADINLTNSKK